MRSTPGAGKGSTSCAGELHNPKGEDVTVTIDNHGTDKTSDNATWTCG